MSTHLEKECDWCGKREEIAEYPNSRNYKSLGMLQPPHWFKKADPLGSGDRLDLCPGCQNRLDQAQIDAREAFDQVLRDAMPRAPRLERDDKMRKRERQRKADGFE